MTLYKNQTKRMVRGAVLESKRKTCQNGQKSDFCQMGTRAGLSLHGSEPGWVLLGDSFTIVPGRVNGQHVWNPSGSDLRKFGFLIWDGPGGCFVLWVGPGRALSQI